MKIEFRTHDDKTKLFSKWYLFPVVPVVGSSVQIPPIGSGNVTAVIYNYRINTIFVFVELLNMGEVLHRVQRTGGESGSQSSLFAVGDEPAKVTRQSTRR